MNDEVQIDLRQEIANQLKRVTELAEEANEDTGSQLGQRASAMATCSALLKEITRTQAEVINMSRIQVIERTLIELLPTWLTEEQLDQFMAEYEERLAIKFT